MPAPRRAQEGPRSARSIGAAVAAAGALVATVVLCGCGDSRSAAARSDSSPARAAKLADRRAGSPATVPAASRAHAARGRPPEAAGRPGAARGPAPLAGRRSRAPAGANVAAASPWVGSAGFRALADSACAAVAHAPGAAPGAEPPGATGAGSAARDGAARAPSSRGPSGNPAQTGPPAGSSPPGVTSSAALDRELRTLARLRVPASMSEPVGRLLSALRQLAQLDRLARPTPSPGLRAAVIAAEREALGAALAAGLQACAPSAGA